MRTKFTIIGIIGVVVIGLLYLIYLTLPRDEKSKGDEVKLRSEIKSGYTVDEMINEVKKIPDVINMKKPSLTRPMKRTYRESRNSLNKTRVHFRSLFSSVQRRPYKLCRKKGKSKYRKGYYKHSDNQTYTSCTSYF